MIVQIIAAYFVTVFFSVMFNNTARQLPFCGIVGAIGWLFYLLVRDQSGSVVLASFAGALIVSIIAYLMSKFRHAPITVFQIPGIIPMVPGMGMYQTLLSVITGDYEQFLFRLLETLQIAGAIAVAMMLVFSARALIERIPMSS